MQKGENGCKRGSVRGSGAREERGGGQEERVMNIGFRYNARDVSACVNSKFLSFSSPPPSRLRDKIENSVVPLKDVGEREGAYRRLPRRLCPAFPRSPRVYILIPRDRGVIK